MLCNCPSVQCAPNYFRPHANDGVAECVPCDNIVGIECGSNTTMETFSIKAGYWRHSSATMNTLECKSRKGWSPCAGGTEARTDGDGYCHRGYRGPRCELCEAPNSVSYFDQKDARCHECREVTAQTIVACSTLSLLLVVTIIGTVLLHRRRLTCCPHLSAAVHGLLLRVKALGPQPKLKVLIAFSQVISVLDTTFSIQLPQYFMDWFNVFRAVDVQCAALVPQPPVVRAGTHM
jgi:hypothetical protein